MTGSELNPQILAVKAIAFHLPQFHPIPENDLWWGKGFTEWTNVRKAVPQFPGHWQPHEPADLGYYDLRREEAREAQAELAARHGIFGFCYYHYWLHGKRLLHFPVDEILRTGRPRFPFCLCWANHNWTRNWDDGNRELLIEQRYSMADHLDHIRWLARVFMDDRYIRIDGKPLFLFLRASAVEYLQPLIDLWREQAYQLGVGELFLAEVESHYELERMDPQCKGLDAVVEFQPDFLTLFTHPSRCASPTVPSLAHSQRGHAVNHHVFDYERVVRLMLEKERPPYQRVRCVNPSWDNTARMKSKAVILHRSSPDLYENWLARVVQEELAYESGDRLIFLNAWNEWAEGNHLEPCTQWGRSYLEATRRVLESASLTNHVPLAQEALA